MVITNAFGVAFTAALLSAAQTGVTFVFPEDGATNEFAWSRLSPESRETICEATGFTPVPPALTATFRMAVRESGKLDALAADNRLDAAEVARRRSALRAKLARKCLEHGLSDERIEAILKRY